MYESISKNDELENEMTLDMSYFWYSDDTELINGLLELNIFMARPKRSKQQRKHRKLISKSEQCIEQINSGSKAWKGTYSLYLSKNGWSSHWTGNKNGLSVLQLLMRHGWNKKNPRLTLVSNTPYTGVRMQGDVHGFDYDQQDRSVLYECKCNFRFSFNVL